MRPAFHDGKAFRAMRALLIGAATLLAPTLLANSAAANDRSGGLLPVPATTIERGQQIASHMLTEKHFYFDPNRPLSVIRNASEAIGKAARRTLPAGQPIPHTAFKMMRVVQRGKPTEARFRMGNLTITASVLPLADAGVGELVQARNIDSNRTITGIVGMDGAIEVSAP